MAQRTVWDHSDPALEMEEIDRIDEENRRKDLFQLLDGINSFSALPNEDNQLDFEIHSLDWDENTNMENIDNDAPEHDDSVGLNESHNLFTLDSSEAPKKNKLSHDVVKNLINGLHIRNSEVHALKYQLKHKELQIEALLTQDQKLRLERDQLEYTVAKNEQDLVLLETKLQDIARFEGRSGEEGQLEFVRGQLLTLANTKVVELGEELLRARLANETDRSAAENKIAQQAAEIKSLRVELENVCNQLAQRTVLYSAHERRWSNALRLNEGVNHDMKEELIQLRTRTQDLNERYEQLEGEKIRLLMQNKEVTEKNNRLEVELSEVNDKLQACTEDIAALSSQNTTLQNTINRLKSADYDSLERDVAQDVENMRRDFRLREDVLRRQVDELRERQLADTQRHEELLQRVQDLQAELNTKDALLLRINDSLLHNSVSEVEVADISTHNFSSDQAPPSVHTQPSADANVTSVMSGNSVATAVQLDGSHSTVAQHSGSLSQDFLIGEQSEADIGIEPEPFEQLNTSDIASDASVSALMQLTGKPEAEPKSDRRGQSGRDVTINLTKGEISKITHVSERSYQMTERLLEKNEELLRELDAAYAQIEAAKSREFKLTQAYQKQGSKLALVLRKAAEMEVRDTDSVSEPNDSSFEHSRDYSVVFEQLESYKQEVRQYEQLVERNRELGAQEAEYEQRYEPALRALQQQVESLRLVNRQLNEQLAELPLEAEASRQASESLIAQLKDQLVKLVDEKDVCLRKLVYYEIDSFFRRNSVLPVDSAPDQSSSDSRAFSLTQYDMDSKFWSNQSANLSMHRTNPAPMNADDSASLTPVGNASTPVKSVATATTIKEEILMAELAKAVSMVAPLRQRCQELESDLAKELSAHSEQLIELTAARASADDKDSKLLVLRNELEERVGLFDQLLMLYRRALEEIESISNSVVQLDQDDFLLSSLSLPAKDENITNFIKIFRDVSLNLSTQFESNEDKLNLIAPELVTLGNISVPTPNDGAVTVANIRIAFAKLLSRFTATTADFMEGYDERIHLQQGSRMQQLVAQLDLTKQELTELASQLQQKDDELVALTTSLSEARVVSTQLETSRGEIQQLQETIVAERESIQLARQEYEQEIEVLQAKLKEAEEEREAALARADTAESDAQTEDDFSLKEGVVVVKESMNSASEAGVTISDDFTADKLRQEFEKKYLSKKKALKAKLRAILQQQADLLESQRVSITDAVRAEYEDQVTNMKNQLAKLTTAVASSSRANNGIQFVFEDDDATKMKEVLLYPEMLSPDVTMELVSSIARRSCSLDDFKDLFDQVGRDVASSDE